MRVVLRIVLPLLLLVLAAGAFGAYHANRLAGQPFRGYDGDEVFLTITPGEPSGAIAAALHESGIIRDQRLFLAALRYRGAAGRLQAGEYRFSEPTSTYAVIDRLSRGDVYYLAVTIPEGLTLFETAGLLSDKGLGDEVALREAFEEPRLIASIDPEAETLEGYLFPETYRFPRRPKPEDVARALVSGFRDVFDETRQRRAADLELTARDVVTLASVVEKETGLGDERPLIASVFWNRLRRRMPLQSDPTVIYELKRRGEYRGNLSRHHLEMESPYNTYRVAGLPPGPIASPGRHALDAVLYPAESDYLYFVSRNDGSHHFSRSLREHNQAVRKYQIEYFRNQRRRARREGDGVS